MLPSRVPCRPLEVPASNAASNRGRGRSFIRAWPDGATAVLDAAMRRACACLAAPRQLPRRPGTPWAACLSTAVPAAAPRDLRSPADLYPGARALRRVVHIHCGPTNSGKTHFALRALVAAESGVYCGPLRLLAWEVHERLNAQGVACNLATGQELLEVPGAEHTACTVEMVQLEQRMDVVVMDEVQMIAHPDRGWAWSRVLLGVQALTRTRTRTRTRTLAP